jgi:hypothetical protein
VIPVKCEAREKNNIDLSQSPEIRQSPQPLETDVESNRTAPTTTRAVLLEIAYLLIALAFWFGVLSMIGKVRDNKTPHSFERANDLLRIDSNMPKSNSFSSKGF